MLFALLLGLLWRNVMAVTYYVDVGSTGGTCSDANAGTLISAPWCTLGKGSSAASVGDTVFIRGGTYRSSLGATTLSTQYLNVINPTNSGVALSGIIFSNYNGENVFIKGSGLATGWTQVNNTEEQSGVGVTFTSGFEIGNTSAFTGSTLFPDATMGIGSTRKSGRYGFYVDMNAIGTTDFGFIYKDVGATENLFARFYFNLTNSLVSDDNFLMTGAPDDRIDLFKIMGSGDTRMSVGVKLDGEYSNYLAYGVVYGNGVTSVLDIGYTLFRNTWNYFDLGYFGNKSGAAGGGGFLVFGDGTTNYSVGVSIDTTGMEGDRIDVGVMNYVGTGSPHGVKGRVNFDDIRVGVGGTFGTVSLGFLSNVYGTTLPQTTGAWTPTFVYEDGNLLTGYTGLSPLSSGGGRWYYDSSNFTLYVHSRGSTDMTTGSLTVEAGRVGSLVRINNKSFVTVAGLNLEHDNTSNGAVYISAGSQNVIKNIYGSNLFSYCLNVAGGANSIEKNGCASGLVGINVGGSGNVVKNNLVTGTVGDGISVGGTLSYIYNNTVYGVGSSFGYGLSVISAGMSADIQNNIVFNTLGSNALLSVAAGATGTVNSDHNLFWNTGTGATLFYWGNVGYSGFVEFKSVSGEDTNSFNADPLFVSVGGTDFSLQASAPGLDTGATLSGITDDMLGVGRTQGSGMDMGAYERVAPSITPSLTPTNTPTLTLTPTPTLSPTPTATGTLSPTPTPTVTGTLSPTPTPTGTSSSSSSSNEVVAPSFICDKPQPVGRPSIFQILAKRNEVTVYFVPPLAWDFDRLYVAYGEKKKGIQHGFEIPINYSYRGVHNLTIRGLKPRMDYIFEIRTGNGCMPGNWSNRLGAKTTLWGSKRFHLK